MTDDVVDTIRAAAHGTFHDDVMLEGFVLVTTAVNSDGERCWSIRTDPDQGCFVTMGLCALTGRFLNEQIEASLGYEEDD